MSSGSHDILDIESHAPQVVVERPDQRPRNSTPAPLAATAGACACRELVVLIRRSREVLPDVVAWRRAFAVGFATSLKILPSGFESHPIFVEFSGKFDNFQKKSENFSMK